jgi:AcrR family transcriptional regulator
MAPARPNLRTSTSKSASKSASKSTGKAARPAPLPADPTVTADAADAPVPDASRASRAVRAPGRRMRSHLLDAAVLLFKQQGLAATAVSQIAEAAGAFPSQVTYYFRSKEALFVEAACREVLYAAQQTEAAAARARTPDTYLAALVASAVQAPALGLYIEALTLARRRPDLSPLIERTTERLHTEGARAYAAMRTRRGWPLADDPALRARRFWALVLGVVLRDAAAGATPAQSGAEVLALLRSEVLAGPPTATPSSAPAAATHPAPAPHAPPNAPRLRAVAGRAA